VDGRLLSVSPGFAHARHRAAAALEAGAEQVQSKPRTRRGYHTALVARTGHVHRRLIRARWRGRTVGGCGRGGRVIGRGFGTGDLACEAYDSGGSEPMGVLANGKNAAGSRHFQIRPITIFVTSAS
jgi:hypothetical protein